MYKVRIIQDANVVKFEFNRLADAIAFVSMCMEVGDLGTEAYIKADEEED